ncbi:MAG: hypothetical protein AB7K24_24880 [Gemmataceae bacterium]
MRTTVWMAAAAALLLASLPARAQLTAALDAVPDDAMGVVFVKNIGEGSAKLSALSKRANFPAFDALAEAKKDLGVDKGLDEKGTLIIALFAGDPEPIPIIFAPVSDYDGFIKQLKPGKAADGITDLGVGRSVVGKKAGFAVFAEAKNRDILKKVLVAKKSVADSLQPVSAWLEKTDAGAALNARGMKELTKHLITQLGQAKAALANAPEEAQIFATWLDGLEGMLKSAGTDVSQMAWGVQYKQESGDLVLAKRAVFVKDSGWAKAGAAIKSPDGGVLAGLPGGEFLVAGGGALPESFMQSMSNFGFQSLKGQLGADKVKKLEEITARNFQGVESMSMVMGLGKENAPLFSGTVSIMKIKDAKDYLDNYAKGIDEMDKIFKDANAPAMPRYSAKKVKVGDLEAVEMTTDMSAMAAADPNLKRAFEAMFGQGAKLVASVALVDKNTVAMSYVPAKEMKGIVAAIKKKSPGLSAEAEVKKTAALLLDDPQWLLYVNPGGFVEFTTRLIRAAAPIAIPIPAYPKSPPVGMAVKIDGAGLEARLAMTGSAIESLGVYIQKVRALAGGNVN